MGKLSATAQNGFVVEGGITINGGDVTAEGVYNGFYVEDANIIINGGNVTAKAGSVSYGLITYRDITINGGNVTVTAGDNGYGLYANGNLTINGGNVTTMAGDNGHGFHAANDTAAIILGYSSATDFIEASNYYGSVKTASGKSFADEGGNLYSGELDGSAIAGKKLIPAVPYLDENGNTKYCTNFTLLTNNTNVSGVTGYLPGGWYVVGEKEVSYGELKFSGDVNLILADESNLSLNVNAQGGASHYTVGMTTTGSLTIYAQSVGDKMGKLSAKTRSNTFALHANKNITIIGGNVLAAAEKEYGKAINVSDGNITIIGGNVMATAVDKAFGLYVDSGNIIFIGGNVKASNYRTNSGSVKIADGKAFMDENGNVYSGTLTTEQLSAIKLQKLIPAMPFLDGFGKTQYCTNFTVLTNNTDISNLSGGWYVVDSKVNYTSMLSSDYDVNLILADGAELSVNNQGGKAIKARYLTIYAQSVGDNMGKLSTTAVGYGLYADNTLSIYGGNVTATAGDYGLYADLDLSIYGGNVTATAGYRGYGLYSRENLTINGGNVTATAGYRGYGLYSRENLTINGGNVTATAGDDGYGLYALNGDITLGYSSATDFIKASNYYWIVNIANGKTFRTEDGSYIYDFYSPLTSEQLNAIADKTLRPATALKVVWNLKMGDNSITPEKLFKSFSGDYAFYDGTVSFTLNEGFNLVTTSYNDGDDHEITQNDGIYSFTMPNKDVTVTAEVKKLLTHSDITVAEILDTTYAGKAIEPNVTVKDGETKLVKDKDYEVSYSDNTNAGTATVTITGKGGYDGTRTATFKIASKSIASEGISVAEIGDQTWTGEEIKPNVVVKNGDAVLVNGTDYTFTYLNNTNAGMATVTITGKGGYDGTKTATFNIVKSLRSGSTSGITFEKIANQEWTGEEIKPDVTVKDGEEKTLAKDKDYTIEYLNNIDMGSADARISGSGYYTDDTVVTFNIFKSIAHKDISVAEIDNQTWTGEERKPEVTVKDGETALDKKTDYSVEYSNNTDAGTATITIEGKGKYFKSRTVTFKIIKSLGHESITVAEIEPQAYTGVAITPEIVVKDGKDKTLVKGRDYELLYENNTYVGTATVTITGKGNYTDTKEVEFKIAKSIGDDNSNITVAQIKDQPKTGEAITPEVIVKDGETALKKDQDYTLSYLENVNAGTGKVIITGINDYVGSRTVAFRIYDPADVVEYLDENGEKQTASGCYEIVAAEGSTAGGALPEKDGCYVVKGEVSYKDNFNFGYNDVKLILTDGAKLTVENTTGSILLYKLFIYAQSKGENMGRFEVSSNGTGLNVQTMTVNGGYVTVSGNIGIAIDTYGSLTVNGGVVNATSNGTGEGDAAILIGDESSFEVNGGSVTAKASSGRDVLTTGKLSLNGGTVVAEGNGIEAAIPGTASSTYAYGVKFAGATIKAASYKLGSKVEYGSLYEAKASIAEGLFYTDGEGNSFDGTLSDEQITAISGKTIHSYIPAIQFKKYVKSDGSEGTLADINANYNEIVPFGIEKEIKVDSVVFTRKFTTSTTGYATVIFPFEVNTENLEGVQRIVEFGGVNEQYQVMMNMVWRKLSQSELDAGAEQEHTTLKAHTPYMVQMYESTLTIHGSVTIKPMPTTAEVKIGNWKFVGTNVFKKWKKGDGELGDAYGYSAINTSEFKAGEFGRIAENAITRAFRAYLVEIKPKAIAARKPFLSNADAQAAVSSSYSTPDHLEVVIIEKDEAGKEHTTVIGRFNTRTGEIKLNPVGERVYDLKGRSIRKDAKKARGAYYGKKATR